MSNPLKRADAEEMLALWGHNDLDGYQDWQLYAWMDELDYRWTGHSWVPLEDVRKMTEHTPPVKHQTAKERREADQQRLARWNGTMP
jgi:hypothetical protein